MSTCNQSDYKWRDALGSCKNLSCFKCFIILFMSIMILFGRESGENWWAMVLHHQPPPSSDHWPYHPLLLPLQLWQWATITITKAIIIHLLPNIMLGYTRATSPLPCWQSHSLSHKLYLVIYHQNLVFLTYAAVNKTYWDMQIVLPNLRNTSGIRL